MTTTATPSTEQYDDLADLLDAHIDGDTHAVNASWQVEKLNKHGHAVKTYANVWEFLDTLLRSNRDKIGSILNNYEDLTTPPSTPFLLTKNTAKEAVDEIIMDTTIRDTLINAYNNYAAPAPLVSGSAISADRQNIEYSYNWVAQTPVSIIEFVEELYLTQKISIANLNMVVQKLDRAQKKEKKTQKGLHVLVLLQMPLELQPDHQAPYRKHTKTWMYHRSKQHSTSQKSIRKPVLLIALIRNGSPWDLIKMLLE